MEQCHADFVLLKKKKYISVANGGKWRPIINHDTNWRVKKCSKKSWLVALPFSSALPAMRLRATLAIAAHRPQRQTLARLLAPPFTLHL
jgi:hypothetical protein